MKPTRPSLLIVGHGSSTASDKAEAALLIHALTLRSSHRFGHVLTHFLTQGAEIPKLPEGEVFLIPFFMSDGFFVTSKIPSLFDLTDFERHDDRRSIYQCDALGVDPELADILAQMALEACVIAQENPAESDIVLIAHGSSKSNASSEAAKLQAAALRGKGQFASVANAFLDEAPTIAEVLARQFKNNRFAICLGLFAAEGPHATGDVPAAIEAALEGGIKKRAHYAGVVGTRPEIVRLIQKSISRRAGEVCKEGQ